MRPIGDLVFMLSNVAVYVYLVGEYVCGVVVVGVDRAVLVGFERGV